MSQNGRSFKAVNHSVILVLNGFPRFRGNVSVQFYNVLLCELKLGTKLTKMCCDCYLQFCLNYRPKVLTKVYGETRQRG